MKLTNKCTVLKIKVELVLGNVIVLKIKKQPGLGMMKHNENVHTVRFPMSHLAYKPISMFI